MARHVVTSIRARLLDACAFPEAGAPRFHLRAGLRCVPRANHLAYYISDTSALTVIRVLHAARDLTRIAEQGGLSARE